MAGQNHRFRVDPSQQARRQQLRYGPVRGGAGRGVAGTAHWGAFEQFVQDISLCLVEPVDEVDDLVAGVQAVFEGDLPRMPRQRRAGVRSDPHRILAPGECALSEVIDRGEHVRLGSAVTDQRQQLVGRHRRGVGLQHQQRVKHGKPQVVELVGGSLDRLTRLSARRQRGDTAGRWLGQVRAQLQQPDQPSVWQVGKPGPQRDIRGVVGHC